MYMYLTLLQHFRNLALYIQLKKPPPRVIPYRLHLEGKKRLAEVLLQQQKRTSVGAIDQSSVLRMLTDSSHASLLLPDDHMEKASLDSRGSTEASASVSSGEVATGTLIDLAGISSIAAVVPLLISIFKL